MLPTVILPGYLESAIAYRPLAQALQVLGFPTVVVPLRRRDWLPTLGGRPVTPILQQLDLTVKQVLQHYNTPQINLIGHSAGGWIARIYLGEKPDQRRGQAIATDPWQAHNCWGDGIVPIAAAHLEGAENLVIPGVKHSPRSLGLWYGSQSVSSNWAPCLA